MGIKAPRVGMLSFHNVTSPEDMSPYRRNWNLGRFLDSAQFFFSSGTWDLDCRAQLILVRHVCLADLVEILELDVGS